MSRIRADKHERGDLAHPRVSATSAVRWVFDRSPRAKKRRNSRRVPPLRQYVAVRVPRRTRNGALLLLLDLEFALLPGVVAEDKVELVVTCGLLDLAFAHAAAELDLGAADCQFFRGVNVLAGE